MWVRARVGFFPMDALRAHGGILTHIGRLVDPLGNLKLLLLFVGITCTYYIIYIAQEACLE